MQPVGPDDLVPLFPMELIGQEVSAEREIPIPEPVRGYSSSGARRRWCGRTGWRRPLGTPAKIYYKYEGVSPAGSHKPNTAVPQALVQRPGRREEATTETGAGQWGSSLAFAGALFRAGREDLSRSASRTTRSPTAR